jgi:hypothetical protein
MADCRAAQNDPCRLLSMAPVRRHSSNRQQVILQVLQLCQGAMGFFCGGSLVVCHRGPNLSHNNTITFCHKACRGSAESESEPVKCFGPNRHTYMCLAACQHHGEHGEGMDGLTAFSRKVENEH